MKKIIIMAIAFVASSFGVFAQVSHSLLVNFKDGKVVEYAFSDMPTVMFSGDNLEIISETGNDLPQPAADLKNFTFKTNGAGVEAVGEKSHVVVRYDGATLAISGLSAASVVNVYSVAGTLCKNAKADADGAVSLDVRDLASGVYVASSQEHTFKFIKK